MTIGIDASRAFRKEKTGTEWYSYHLLREIVRQNLSHTIVLYTDRRVLPQDIGFDFPSSVEVKYLAWPIKRLWTQGRLSLEMMVRPPDVLFIPSHAIPLIHPKKTITTIHDIGFLKYPESYSKKDLAYLKWSTSYAVTHAFSLITVSEFSKRELLDHYPIPPEKIHVTHLGYDESIYHHYPNEEIVSVQKKYNLTKPYLICIARLEPRKNISFLIDVFDVFKEKGYAGDLVLIGPDGYDSQSIHHRIEASAFARAVHCLGWIEEKEKALLLAGADCFLFPSLYEGFGIPVIEAQACGTPVICSNTGSLPEVAGEGAFYCDPRLQDHWIKTLESIFSDEKQKGFLHTKGFENINRFNWANTAQQTFHALFV